MNRLIDTLKAKLNQVDFKNLKKKGQGIIEYAGALVIAALIVVAVLVIARDRMTNVYNDIFKQVETYFASQTTNIK